MKNYLHNDKEELLVFRHSTDRKLLSQYLQNWNEAGYWMERALELALDAHDLGEVPVGSILLLPDGQIVAERNRIIETHDPTAHAEMLCIRNAAAKMQNERLGGCLITTLEPCAMCAGAMIWARVQCVLYAASDPKAGACSSVLHICEQSEFNHKVEVWGGFMAEKSRRLLQNFFQKRRRKKIKD